MMMLSLFKKIPTISGKTKTKIIFSVIILLIIWLLLPLIPISTTHPFASFSMRLTITLLLVAGIGIWYGVVFIQKHQLKSFTIIKEWALKIWSVVKNWGVSGWQYSKEYYHDLHDKIRRDQKRRRLKRLPWYLVLGSPQSGKHAFMQNSGLFFQRPEHVGEEALNYVEQFPDFEWWFTQQAILLDVMSNNQEKDATEWKKLVKLLKRERRNRPFNGVVLTLSLPELLLLNNKDRQDFIQRLSIYIRDIYSHFKAFVPVYIVFNKCDLIDGFMEFFENLSKEELHQVWGMSLPISQSNDLQFVINFFQREYSSLIQQLRKRVMWALDTEKTLRGRELINGFPQQMNLFRKPIEQLIAELFGATRYQRAVQLRGIYFTSCTQGQGIPQDFLLQAMSKKFHLVPPNFQRPQRIGESYFVRGLFFEVMLPEANLLGNSERRKKHLRLLYRFSLLGCPVLVLALGLGMHEGYLANKKNLVAINQYVDYYNIALDKIKAGDPDLTHTLPVLHQLAQARELYRDNENWGMHLLFASHYIKGTLDAATQRALALFFLPRVAAQLENDLSQNVKDQNILYADLKGYLAFSAINQTDKNSLKAPMAYQWDADYAAQPQTIEQLKYYLNLALQSSPTTLPLDAPLISRLRNQLAQVDPEERAYGLLSLRANVSDAVDLDLASLAGNDFRDVFVPGNISLLIPSLYTKEVYQQIYLPQYSAIASEVAEDNRDIGLLNANRTGESKSDLEDNLQTTYNQHYIQAWDSALQSVKVKPFSSLNDAVSVLSDLADPQSPLLRLLNTVYDNTSGVNSGGLKVDDHFKAINGYSQNTGWGANWRDTAKVLAQLRDYLTKLQQAPNQDQASFDVATAVIQGKAENPMKQLTDLASKAPEPVKSWLMAIANNCWQIILRGAHNNMNTAWNNQVVTVYNSGMRGRYPLDPKAYSSASIDAFNTLFGYGGVLEKYFTTYIQPFVNTNGEQWKFYNQNGLTIEIPASNMEIFQRIGVIRQEFFQSGSAQAQLHLSIKPLTLDRRASSIEFVAGSQQVEYSHGPQNETAVTWPFPFNTQDSRIVITTFNSDQYGHSASGDWSLFKMFNYGVLKPGSDAGTYQFEINFGGQVASFEITGPNDIDVFTLKQLNGFGLPQVIAPNK